LEVDDSHENGDGGKDVGDVGESVPPEVFLEGMSLIILGKAMAIMALS